MVSLEEQTVLAMKARGLDIAAAQRRPLRQMFKHDIVLSALAIAMFLQIYYIAVAFFPVMFQTALGFSQSQSNSLLNWYWSANAISLLTWGTLSDRLRVRKPFMMVGAFMTCVTTIAFIHEVHGGHPTFASIATLLVFIGVWSGCTYAPWMAGFTEMVEEHNPALVATGLAVWGWLLRLVVSASFLILPHLITSVTPLVDDGPTVQAQAATLAHDYPQLYAEVNAYPGIFKQLGSYASPSQIPPSVLNHAIITVGADALQQLQQPKAQQELKALTSPTVTKVQSAQSDAPKQWSNWIWACAGGQLFFMACIFLMAGPWSPRRAREELAKRDAEIMAFMPEPKTGAHDTATNIDLTAASRIDAGNS
jgi:hypothetical protein